MSGLLEKSHRKTRAIGHRKKYCYLWRNILRQELDGKMTSHSKTTHWITSQRKVVKTYPGQNYSKKFKIASGWQESSSGGPSILFNSSFTSRGLHLARSSSTLWCNKIFANWLLVGPFCWDFLSSHRLKVAFEAKSLSFAQWLLAFYMKERGMPSRVPDTKKFLKEVARNH